MARQRDHKAIYARRKQLAAERGLSTAQARGHARITKGERPISDLVRSGVVRAAGRKPKPTDTSRKGVARRLAKARRSRKLVDFGGSRIVTNNAAAVTVAKELRRAARDGRKVVARIVAHRSDGVHCDGDNHSACTIVTFLVGVDQAHGYRVVPPILSAELIVGDQGVDPGPILTSFEAGGYAEVLKDHQ